MLGVTPSTVSRLVSREELTPAVQLPGKRGAFLFDEEEVGKLVASRRAA